MINHQQYFESAVKDELAKLTVSKGIDKSFVGYALSFSFGPVQTQQGQALMPLWLLVVSLRAELVGTNPVMVPVMVPGQTDQATGIMHMPPEADFRGAARQAIDVAIQARDALMHPDKIPGAVAGQLVR
jgi:hypothetical protein